MMYAWRTLVIERYVDPFAPLIIAVSMDKVADTVSQ